jgi:lactate dehydrogenase-like 2-hydroxyacid dehydrogenase
MSDQIEMSATDNVADPKVADRKAAEAMGTALGLSLQQLASANDAQQIAIMALTAIVALSPGTATIDLEKLSAVLAVLTKGQPNGDVYRKRIAQYVALIVDMARKLPAAMEEAKKRAAEAPVSAAQNPQMSN